MRAPSSCILPALSLALLVPRLAAPVAAFSVDRTVLRQELQPTRRHDGLPTKFALTHERRIRSLRWTALLSSSSSSAAPNENSQPKTNKSQVDPIVERARQRAGVPVPEAPPKLFDDELLGDMQSVLQTLERRVKEGPTALTPHEIDDLASAVDRIVAEMKSNNGHQQQQQQSSPSQAQTQPAGISPSGHLLHAEPEVISALRASDADDGADGDRDTSDDEGPAFSGKGGMGQPRGTVNTYVIPGMDEMTAEEYQETLQQSIIERQRRRRASGVVGNLSSTSYLDSLKGNSNNSQGGGSKKKRSYGPSSSSRKGNDDDDDEDDEV